MGSTGCSSITLVFAGSLRDLLDSAYPAGFEEPFVASVIKVRSEILTDDNCFAFCAHLLIGLRKRAPSMLNLPKLKIAIFPSTTLPHHTPFLSLLGRTANCRWPCFLAPARPRSR